MNKHRIVEVTGNHLDVSDTINLMACRAISVLNLITLQFESDHAFRICNEHLVNAIDSAIYEIEDIKTYLLADKQVG